ncbi:MAG: prevent-host-death protein [Alphaproteobacteria bacterium GWC2_42_16]|nr:MAG: prevent-host-death protein [Alphaproteobacteria bacterium GWC2_42_16]OFW91936.1 MAG: prevent-host-death protein [Alphaproteobacteria bacterium RIFCSPHIGHO2_12_42_13]OFX01231.1 MAG: prevent-host-death protein [Alphaproteobacteria bacterium RIFCSPLOWO2_02_42_7]HBG33920.1 type II toxin-antitoxin system prevent-host-death family antitoxin [Holosporales bacterium]HBW24843.1 type II toxin-antitoxin system prevent-host-death family antitoxin [Holosporales bacterium]
MITISAYEAKTHLSELLNKVKSGERVLITKHHVPIAMMSPAPLQRKRSLKETVEAMKQFRKGNKLQGLHIKNMIEEGRR